VKELAMEVFDLLQKEVGTTEVLKVYEFVRKSLGEKRQRRREERKLALVLDPEKVAQQRMDKHTKKINSKKRKIDKQAEKRGKFGKRTKERALSRSSVLKEAFAAFGACP
jgi:hypothetical protein